MPTNAKVCTICREDCSGRPRIKDPAGNYACKACVEKHAGAGGEGGKAGAAPVAAGAPDLDDGPLDLVEDAAGSPGIVEPVLTKPCVGCGRIMPPGAVVCTHCGFDTRKGVQVGTGIGASAHGGGFLTCPKCNYDLKGLTKETCPECGTKVGGAKSIIRANKARKAEREAVLVPLILTAAGLGGAVALLMAKGYSAGPVLAYVLTLFLGQWIGCSVMYMVCCWLWMGSNHGPLGVALRMAGVVAPTMALSFIYFPFSWLVVIALFIGLLIKLFELDPSDAWLTLIVSSIGGNVLKYLVVALLQSFRP